MTNSNETEKNIRLAQNSIKLIEDYYLCEKRDRIFFDSSTHRVKRHINMNNNLKKMSNLNEIEKNTILTQTSIKLIEDSINFEIESVKKNNLKNLFVILNFFKDLLRRFNHIDESRKLSKKIFFFSLSTFSIGILLPLPVLECRIPWENDKTECEKYISSLSNAILGVSASLLAASLADILVGMRDVWIREEKQGSFRKFFGIDRDGNNKIAVILPQFSIKNLKEDNKLKEVEDIRGTPFNDMEKILIRSNEGFYSSADLRASTSLSILFDRIKILSNDGKEAIKPKLEYTNDTNNAHLANFSNYSVLFIIGLFSNSLLNYSLSKINQTNYFKVDFEKNQSINIKKTLSDTWEKTVSDDESYSYGLLARLKVENQVVFVAGGIDAQLTSKCGDFLLNNWESIYQKLNDAILNDSFNRDFAILMRMKKEEAKAESTTINMNNIDCFCIQNSDQVMKFVIEDH